MTDDYQPGEDNWMVGISSMFADAIGLAPYKDNFWTTAVQPGNPYGELTVIFLECPHTTQVRVTRMSKL